VPPAPPSSRSPAAAGLATHADIPPAPKLEPWTPPSSRPAAPAAEETTPVSPALAEDVPSAAAEGHTAVRVAIADRSKGGGRIVVRVLGHGATPMHGEIEALLVALAAGVDLRQI
jgi:hypothetical protein